MERPRFGSATEIDLLTPRPLAPFHDMEDAVPAELKQELDAIRAGIIDRRIDPEPRPEAGAGLLAGPPVSSIRLRILPDRWGDALGPWTTEHLESQQLPSGQPGEIVVSGDHVLPGYLDGVGDSESKIHVDGRVWHRTGDAGYVDDRGRLWLLGRCSAKVSDSHGVVYPFAVEAAASGLVEIGIDAGRIRTERFGPTGT